MTHYVRKSMLSLVAASALVTGVAVPAQAANNNQQNGLVNVALVNVLNNNNVAVLNNVNVGVAANVAAAICGIKVGPVAVLGAAVDRSGVTQSACTIGNQAVRLTQA
jgi:hypothetical protein